MERADFDQWTGREVARILALVETERRYYHEMVATLPVALAVLSADRFVVSANRAFRQLFGVNTEDLYRRPIDQILPSNRLIEKIRDVSREGTRQPGFLLEFKDKLFRINIVPIRGWDDEMVMEILLVIADVSDVRTSLPAATTAPEAAPAPPPALPFPVESTSAVLWIADASTLQFLQVAGDMEHLLGHPPGVWLESKDFFTERIHPGDRAGTLAHYRNAIRNSQETSAEFRAITAGGETIWCLETVRVSQPGVLSGVCTTITQRKQLEQQRLTAERTDALRGLSAQLAHDLNNPLMIITGYAEEMLQASAPNDPRRGDIEQILTATRRMGSITSQLLEFTRKHAEPPGTVDLAAVLSGLIGRVAQEEGVTIDIRPSAPVWARVNRQQLEEVVAALISGDRQGAPRRTRLTIACDTAAITELTGGTEAVALNPGVYARLIVQDNGQGIDAGNQAALFESFLVKDPATAEQKAFAALARAYAIVRDWGGDIRFDSEPSRGSRFDVYLPLAEPEAGAPDPAATMTRAAPSSIPVPASPADRKRETILVVDDEPGIRALVAKILRREGYVVLEAGSASEAVTVTLIHGSPVHLLLTDVMLPDRSGREVAEQLHATVPGVRVLYMSGFTDDESVRTGNFPPGSRFLQKPFTLGALVGTVRAALDGQA